MIHFVLLAFLRDLRAADIADHASHNHGRRDCGAIALGRRLAVMEQSAIESADLPDKNRETPYRGRGFRPIAEYWRTPYGL